MAMGWRGVSRAAFEFYEHSDLLVFEGSTQGV